MALATAMGYASNIPCKRHLIFQSSFSRLLRLSVSFCKRADWSKFQPSRGLTPSLTVKTWTCLYTTGFDATGEQE